MFCTKCGASLREDANFCDKCGHPVTPPIVSQPEDTIRPMAENDSRSDARVDLKNQTQEQWDNPANHQNTADSAPSFGGANDYNAADSAADNDHAGSDETFRWTPPSGMETDVYGSKPLVTPILFHKTVRAKRIDLWGMTLTSVCALLLIFLKWITVPITTMFGGQIMRFSLFQSADIANALTGFAGDLASVHAIHLPFVFVISGLLLGIGLMLFAALAHWKKWNKLISMGAVGALLCFIISLMTIVVTTLLRWKLNRELSGLFQISLRTTAVPWLLLVVSVANLVFTLRQMARCHCPEGTKVMLITSLASVALLIVITAGSYAVEQLSGPAQQPFFPGNGKSITWVMPDHRLKVS